MSRFIRSTEPQLCPEFQFVRLRCEYNLKSKMYTTGKQKITSFFFLQKFTWLMAQFLSLQRFLILKEEQTPQTRSHPDLYSITRQRWNLVCLPWLGRALCRLAITMKVLTERVRITSLDPERNLTFVTTITSKTTQPLHSYYSTSTVAWSVSANKDELKNGNSHHWFNFSTHVHK